MVLFSSENEDGEVWYYTSPLQLEELMLGLDQNELEVALYRELSDYKEEIVRQMELTETITNQFKGNKKSYLEIENSKIFLDQHHLLNLFRLTSDIKIICIKQYLEK